MMFHVIDDADFVREFVVGVIKEHGYESISFSCPEEYIDFVNSPDYKNPIAVLTDVTMPKMSGYQMMDIVSKLKSDLKFIIMTGEPEIRSEFIDRACMYLGKPFSPESLIKVIDSLIRCHVFSPSDEHGCDSADHRNIFPIEEDSCPHRCNDCSTDCS